VKLTFLGTGTSHGIPVPTCTCPVCLSSDSRDKRYRSSIMVQKEGKTLVVDTGPEFRLQALRANILHIDFVLYTHCHADHFYGIDDLRVYCHDKPMPVYCDEDVKLAIERRFSYVLHDGPSLDGLPHLAPVVLEPWVKVNIDGFDITPVPIMHGRDIIYAYRIDDLVYATDCSGLISPDRACSVLAEPKVLVVGALRYKAHPSHFCVEQSIEFARRIHARQTYFTHMCHDLSHQRLCDELPADIRPAYDMLTLEV